MKLTHFSLFTGIGGIDLAAEWAGFTTVGQCEWADFPTKVLEKHWPDVPRWRDIHDVTAESVRARGIGKIDLISGGFPCQPFSVAGKQRSKEDDRYLWPEMCRVIEELKPTWVVGENVTGIIKLALDDVLLGLENIGYTTIPFVIPACGVDAPHRRDRIFVVAYSNSERCEEQNVSAESIQQGFSCRSNYETHVADASVQPNEKTNPSIGAKRTRWNSRNNVGGCGWEREPRIARAVPKFALGRVVDGVSDGLDGLATLGNAVVPQQVYPILKAIYDIETKVRSNGKKA